MPDATATATAAAGAKRRAIVLVPGLRRDERFCRRDVLVANLATVEVFPLEPGEPVEVAGESGRRLNAQPVRGADLPAGPDLEVFEAFWADMIPDQAAAGPWQKLGRGFDLLAYWLLSWRTWRAFSVSRYITFGLMAGGVLLVLWYVGLALLVADALARDPTLTASVRDLPGLGTLLDGFLKVAAAIGGWRVWALAAFLLTFIQVEALVLTASFIKDYFENRPDENEVGLRDRLRGRVRASLENVLRADYDEVFVVAHSFGTIVAAELLADWPHRDDFARLTLVTLGSPVAVLRYRSTWLEGERRHLLGREELTAWYDFHAPTDWLCGAFTGHVERYGDAFARTLHFEAPLRQKLTGQTHLLYYRDAAVLERLAAPAPRP